ncbi:MAG: L,D-transpeptidase family protein [Dehalococcoidia bacterium]
MPAAREYSYWTAFALVVGVLLTVACTPHPSSRRPAITSQDAPAATGAISTPRTVSTSVGPIGVRATGTATAPSPAGVTGTPSATPTRQPTAEPVATASALAAPVQSMALQEHVDALALGGATPLRSLPSMVEGATVGTLIDRQPIVILAEVRGQRWVVGDQTWAMAIQEWSNLWYQIEGGYVYAGFVYIPRSGELEQIAARNATRWIDVDMASETARAMIGDRVIYTAAVTTGKPGYETPGGDHLIPSWGRKFNETMTSSQAGIQDQREQYNVHNVLYTQYFDDGGDALHLNYWQPEGVFGRQQTSHGCVGLLLHDAQFMWLFAGPGTRVRIHPVTTPTPITRPSRTPTAASAVSPSPVVQLPSLAGSATIPPGTIVASPVAATSPIPATPPIPARGAVGSGPRVVSPTP